MISSSIAVHHCSFPSQAQRHRICRFHLLFRRRRRGSKNVPHFHDAGSTRWQHAVLKAIQIFAVDRRHEFACHEAEEDFEGEVVFSEAAAELEVLVEHSAEG